MSAAEIEKQLVDLLKKLQAGTGEKNCEITSATVPLKDLGFFDSLLALETTIALEECVGKSFGEDSVFSDRESGEELSVSQIVRWIEKIIGAGAKHD